MTWLYRVTTNHCLNRLRDSKRRAELLVEHHGSVPGVWQSAHDPEAGAFLRQIWSALEPELALIGVYHYVDGMTQDEIARVLDCSPRTVGNRLQAITAQARALAGLEVS